METQCPIARNGSAAALLTFTKEQSSSPEPINVSFSSRHPHFLLLLLTGLRLPRRLSRNGESIGISNKLATCAYMYIYRWSHDVFSLTFVSQSAILKMERKFQVFVHIRSERKTVQFTLLSFFLF